MLQPLHPSVTEMAMLTPREVGSDGGCAAKSTAHFPSAPTPTLAREALRPITTRTVRPGGPRPYSLGASAWRTIESENILCRDNCEGADPRDPLAVGCRLEPLESLLPSRAPSTDEGTSLASGAPNRLPRIPEMRQSATTATVGIAMVIVV
jgi:hypothetical protein